MTQGAAGVAVDGPAVQAPAPSHPPRQLPVLVERVVGAVLAATLVAYMLLGNFTRHVQDDFSATLDVRAYGFWKEQVLAYQRNDGHFLGTALQDAGGMLNEVFVRVLPGALIAAWVLVIALALRNLIPAAGRPGRLLVAAGMVYATVRDTPNPFMSLYWMTASLAYVLPLLLAAVLVWLASRPAARGRRRAALVVLAGVVAFLAAGLAEEYTAAQTVALTLAVGVAVLRLSAVWRDRLPVLAGAWVGSVAGLGVMAAAPGNAIRAAAIARIVGPRPSLLSLPGFTFPEMRHFFHVLIATHWAGLLALAILVGMVGARAGAMTMAALRPAIISAALATLAAVVVVFAAMTPAALEQAQPPHDYSQVVLVHVSVCAVAAVGWVGGRLCRALADREWARRGSMAHRRGPVAGLAALLAGAVVVAGPIATLAAMHRDLPAIEAYAQAKDAQAAAATAAHAAGRSSVVVFPVRNVESMGIFSHTASAELQSDPKFWINVDVASFFGITSIATTQPP